MANNLWSRLVAGAKAFREAYMTSGAPTEKSEYGEYNARLLRYEVLWAFFENTAYRDIHSWATRLRAEYGLYKYIRNIYNPAHRIGEFWQTHIFAGELDSDAGDGQGVPSALPITTPVRNDALRMALSQLWRVSNWQSNKDLVPLYGAVLGDVGIRVVDDVVRGQVYLQPLHPGLVKEVEQDAFGNVKAYTLEEARADPRRDDTGMTVTYTEECSRESDQVIFKTLLNGQPYAWNEAAAEWAEPYGFVPLVLIQHNNVGQDWGWSEFYAGLSKVREADDIASKVSDQLRKIIDPVWLLSGVDKQTASVSVTAGTASESRPAPGRDELPALWGPPGASAHPLVAPLDIGGALAHISNMLQELERDFPELQADIWGAQGVSGRALRIARQRIESKVLLRRPAYDDAMRRIQQMAVAIGGYRRYAGFESFGLDSYARGLLDHSIGKRPVFALDPLDDLERDAVLWQVVVQVTSVGGPRAGAAYLIKRGWSVNDVALFFGGLLEQQNAQVAA